MNSGVLKHMMVAGGGNMRQLKINGVLKYKRMTWRKTLYIQPGVGVYCDGRKRCNLMHEDYFSYRWLYKYD